MKLDDFKYFLPEDLIAQEPLSVRDQSRLMVLHKNSGITEHRHFRDLVEYLTPQDVLVINDTKVIPARLLGNREHTQAAIEVLLLTRHSERVWEVLVRPGRKVPRGTAIVFGSELRGVVEDVLDNGNRMIRFEYTGLFEQLLDRLGLMPLPPYIKKKLTDSSRYQTVYAKDSGSVAAPTAGLHFTKSLLAQITALGVSVVPVLLHVGLGTFRPVKVEEITEHQMHAEYYAVPEETAEVINSAKAAGGRVIAVGTTTVRCLETAARQNELPNQLVGAGTGWTGLFIYPGYNFQVVDCLITNFHLPGSTLLMMVSALIGRKRLLEAYALAVQMRYRFFSFGDAMLINSVG